MKNLKVLLLAGAALLLAPVIAFAGGGGQAAQAEKAPAPFLTEPGKLPLVTQPTVITLGTYLQPSITDYYDNYFTKMVEKDTGLTVKFEFFAAAQNDAHTQFELMVSSNQKLPDIVALNLPNWRDHGENGVFIDLNPYFDKHAFFYKEAMAKLKAKYGDDSEEKRIKIKGSSFTGKRFAYPAYNDNESDLQLHTTMINKTWLANLGLKMPATTQELRDVLIAFRDRDPNKNGKKDEIPMLGSLKSWHGDLINWLVNAFVYWNPEGTNAGTLNATGGKLWTPYNTNEYREALRYIRGLVQDGLLSTSTFSLTQDEMIALLNPPDDVYTLGVSSGHPVIVWKTGGTTPDHYTCFPSVTGPNGVNFAPVGFPSVVNGQRSYISKDAQYPDVAFRLLDYFSREYTGMVMRWGEEGADWTWAKSSETDVYGHKSIFDTPNLLWGSTAQKQNWRGEIGLFRIDNYGVFRDDGSWSSKRGLATKDYISMSKGKDVKEKVDEVILTQEENDSIKDILTSLTNYVQEWQAYFCVGQRDIEKDWDAYIKGLNDIGLSRYLDIVQKAYTRTISN
jgi:putative aldouronate transport system substrate-binding protein